MTRVERESMNFKLPKPLASALRKAASPQAGKTATDIVIRGLLHEARRNTGCRGIYGNAITRARERINSTKK